MKLIFFALVFFIAFSKLIYSQGYKIDIQIKQLHNNEIYLGYHYGNEQYVIDTVKLDKAGKGVLQGSNKLPEGVYMIVLPSMKYFDILICDTQTFKIKNDTTNLIENLEITGSKENEDYVNYQKISSKYLTQINELTKSSNGNSNNKVDSLQTLLKTERLKVIANHKGTFFGSLINSMLDPEIPQSINKSDNPADVIKKLNYLYFHYFDNYDFTDERLLFSPILYNKLLNYYGKIIENNNDTLINSLNNLINLSFKNADVYRYLLNTMLGMFDLSGELPNDEAFVYLAENYYLKDLTPWVNDEFLARLKKHVEDLKPTLMGSYAPSLNLVDTTGKKISLNEVKSCFTLVIFWNPECEHCAEYLSALKNVYKSFPQDKFQVYAVLATDNKTRWKSFIKDNNLPWINVYDATLKNSFIQSYKLYMIPRTFLLSSDKHILLKDFEVDELQNFLNENIKKSCH